MTLFSISEGSAGCNRRRCQCENETYQRPPVPADGPDGQPVRCSLAARTSNWTRGCWHLLTAALWTPSGLSLSVSLQAAATHSGPAETVVGAFLSPAGNGNKHATARGSRRAKRVLLNTYPRLGAMPLSMTGTLGCLVSGFFSPRFSFLSLKTTMTDKQVNKQTKQTWSYSHFYPG